MKVNQFTNSIAEWPGPDFRVRLYMRGGHIIEGRYIQTINLPGDDDIILLRTAEPVNQRTFIAIEAIDAVEFLH